MPLDTNTDQSPYFDDFDKDDSYHRVLFKPSLPVQNRELHAVQRITENQIEEFGGNIYKEGTIIKGCSFYHDPTVNYIKAEDNRVDLQPLNVLEYAEGYYLVNSNNLIAEITNVDSGLESQAPDLNTFYFNYVTTGTSGETAFVASEQLSIYPNKTSVESFTIDTAGTGYSVDDPVYVTTKQGDVLVGNVSSVGGSGEVTAVTVSNTATVFSITAPPTATINSVGTSATLSTVLTKSTEIRVANTTFSNQVGSSYRTSVTDGIIYQKGRFVEVDAQSIIVSKYNNVPDGISLGFQTNEAIVNSSIDTTLVDNASGFKNENAPGADRLKLTPTLVVNTTVNADASNNFFTLIRYESGNPAVKRTDTQFNSINETFAKRTREESGDYVIDYIPINSESISGNTTHRNLVTGSGIAYVNGERVEYTSPIRVATPVADTFVQKSGSVISQNYGNYVEVNELYGDFQFNEGDSVFLYDTAFTTLTSGTDEQATPRMPVFTTGTLALDRSSPDAVSATAIGTAKIKSVVFASGVQGTPTGTYRIYLFDISMFSGKSFKNARSLWHYAGAESGYDTNGLYTGVADLKLVSGNAVLKENSFKTLVFPWGKSAIKRMRTGASPDTIYRFRTAITTTELDSTTGNVSFTITGSGNAAPYADGYVGDVNENDFIVIPRASANGGVVNTSATYTVTNASSTITGNNFDTLNAGDYLSYTDGGNTSVKRIVSVNSDVNITVDPPVDDTKGDALGAISGANFLKHYPAYVPFHTASKESANVQITGSGLNVFIDIGEPTLSNNVDCSIYYDVQRTGAEHLRKNLEEIYIKIDVDGGANTTGPFTLGVPDVYDITAIYANDGSYTEASIDEVTSQFKLDNGQKDGFYALSKLEVLPGQTPFGGMTTPKMVAKVRVFRKSTTGGGFGFFNVESYPVDDVLAVSNNQLIFTENIPVFTSPTTGIEYDLRDSVDFRSFVANTVAYAATLGAATILTPGTSSFELNTLSGELHVPSPNENMTASLEYYQGRIDKISISDNGNIKIISGQPDDVTIPPSDDDNAMTIGVVNIPPYPSLDAKTAVSAGRLDYGIGIKQQQTKRYSMKDINNLDQRLDRLEYYTSLNLLEKNASDLMIPSENNTALNRFKNGIMVDNFNNLSVANVVHSEFLSGLDPARHALVPRFIQTDIPLKVDELTDAIKTTDLISINYEHELLLENDRATTNRVCAGAFWKYNGDIKLFPDYDNFYDIHSNPIATADIDVDLGQTLVPLVEDLNQTLPMTFTSTSIVNADGSTTTTTTESGGIALSSSSTTTPVGDFVTDINFSPFIRGQLIHFHVTGLRPDMVHHVFFDETNVDSITRPAIVNSNNIVTIDNFQVTDVQGGTLTSNSKGELFGVIYLPSDTYFVGDRKVIVSDVATYSNINTSISLGSTFFRAFNFSVETTGLTLTTRTSSVSSRSSTSSFTTPSVPTVTPDPVPTPVPDVIDDPEADVQNDPTLPFPATDPTPETNPVPVVVAPTTTTTIPSDNEWDDWAFDGFWGNIDGNYFDPIAQTFFVRNPSTQSSPTDGFFVSKVDLFFQAKDDVTGITFEMREVDNGFPTQRLIPFSKVHLKSSDVSVSANGTVATTVTMDSPVFLRADKEYAFVLLPDGNSPNYRTFVSKVGDADLSTGIISNSDWGDGIMFLSTNDRTWQPILSEDVKFKMYFSRFTHTSATAKLVNEDHEYLTVANTIGTFQIGEHVTQDGANATGTLAFTTSNTLITGTGTDFSLLSAGDEITLVSNTGTVFDVVKITSIANTTSMNIKGYPSFADDTSKFREVPVGIYSSGNNTSITLSNSSATTGKVFGAANTIYGVESGANTVITTVDDKVISNFEPHITRTSPQNTQITMGVKSVEIDGGYTLGAEKFYNFNDKNYPNANANIMSKSNEIVNFASAKSLEAYFYLSTTARRLSPILDNQNLSLLSYTNIINNDTTNEHLPNSGNATAKYVSKIVTLEDGLDAEDLRVYVTAYKPSGTDIKVYVKLLNENDETKFEDRHWSELDLFSQSAKVSSSDNQFDYLEYSYQISRSPDVDETTSVGTVSTTASSATITGLGTEFNTGSAAGEFFVGDLIKIVEIDNTDSFFISTIQSVTNDTEVITDDVVPFTGSGLTYYKIASAAEQQAYADPNNTTQYITTYYNENKERFTTYKTFAVKIVLLSDTQYKIPRVKDYRLLALSV